MLTPANKLGGRNNLSGNRLLLCLLSQSPDAPAAKGRENFLGNCPTLCLCHTHHTPSAPSRGAPFVRWGARRPECRAVRQDVSNVREEGTRPTPPPELSSLKRPCPVRVCFHVKSDESRRMKGLTQTPSRAWWEISSLIFESSLVQSHRHFGVLSQNGQVKSRSPPFSKFRGKKTKVLRIQNPQCIVLFIDRLLGRQIKMLQNKHKTTLETFELRSLF